MSKSVSLFGRFALYYQGQVGSRLKKFGKSFCPTALSYSLGLKYEDILNEAMPAVQEAVNRLPASEVSNRNKRFKRAIDLSVKRTYLAESVQEKEEPFAGYLGLSKVEKELEERKLLQ
jgi:hypothetical protein